MAFGFAVQVILIDQTKWCGNSLGRPKREVSHG